MTDKIPKTYMLDKQTLRHVQNVAQKMRASDSYALRTIISEHEAWEEVTRANNISQQLATPTPQ